MREVLSANAYAKHRDVSHVAVHKAIKNGRLRRSVTRRKGPNGGDRYSIDVALADEEWTANTDPSQQREQPTGAAAAVQAQLFEAARSPADEKAPADPQSGLTLLKARAVREGYDAKLKQLEYELRSGKLLDADEVRREQFRLGRELRDQVLGVPKQVAPTIATMRDPREIETLIYDALERALYSLTETKATDGAAGG